MTSSDPLPGGKRSADFGSLPANRKRPRVKSPITSIELSTKQSNFELRWNLAESQGDWLSDRGWLFHTLCLIPMIDGQYPELDVHHFFPYWEEGDDMESIPAGFLENKITWPLCGYVPDTPDVILGLEQRWPYPPQPEQITNDSMQVDMSQSK
jgi:hypothetical protein